MLESNCLTQETISAINNAEVLEKIAQGKATRFLRFRETNRNSMVLLEKVVLNRVSLYTKNVATLNLLPETNS